MVMNCTNPKCGKPLRYLREGRIFVFDVTEGQGVKSTHRLEHFWLCGACSKTLRLEMTSQGVRAVTKHALQFEPPVSQPLAS